MPTQHPDQRLVVTTRRLPSPVDLMERLPVGDPNSTWCWLRAGQGFVGAGSVSSLEVSGPLRFEQAQKWWAGVQEHAVVLDEVGVPGSGLVAFASFAFDADSASASSLHVPARITGRHGDVCFVTTARWIEQGLAEESRLSQLSRVSQLAGARAIPQPPVEPTRTSWTEGPVARADWADVVRDAVGRIRAGEAEKIVLARQVLARIDGLDLRWVLGRLVERYGDDAWVFAVDGLVGATPEMLVAKQGDTVTARVLAGTRRAEPHPEAAAAELAESVKDLAEHRYARDSVVEALEPLVLDLVAPKEPDVLTLHNVVHLATDVTGRASVETSPLRLAEAVHPSAAVCGTPTPAAEQVIQELEHADRGRYAGPVGWMSAAGDAQWGLALRCAELLNGSNDQQMASVTTWRLCAGGGIVADSDPLAEVAETDAKLQPMSYALGLADTALG